MTDVQHLDECRECRERVMLSKCPLGAILLKAAAKELTDELP